MLTDEYRYKILKILETNAEISQRDLARELGISYAAICPIANHAAGRGESLHAIQYEEVMVRLNATMVRVRNLIAALVIQTN